MKVFYYRPEHVGLDKFPPGEMRINGAEETGQEDADIFVMPMVIHHLQKKLLDLPYLRGNEKKHVFWNMCDDMTLWYDLPCLFLRGDATREIKSHDKNTMGWPWPVDNIFRPHEAFQYDVVFQGWESDTITKVVCDSVKKTQLSTHIQVHNYFFGYHWEDPAYDHLKISFKNTLSKSRLSLCPRSFPGVTRYRFFEAMSMGRVPVHFNDDRVLPFSNQIDYDKCSIHIPENRAGHSGEILSDWLGSHNDQEITEMGLYGRKMWESYLDSSRWNDFFAIAIEEHLRTS